METKENTTYVDKVVTAMRKAAVEMEEFQLKVALGKADARDEYEELKKKFSLYIHESKFKIRVGKAKVRDVNTKLDELAVQLALGKAETIDVFRDQKKKLLLILHDIEVKIRNNETLNRLYALLLVEIEKFKVQLEVIEQKFARNKEGARSTFEKGKLEFNHFLDDLKTKMSGKEESRWDHFQDEVSEAFVHLKKAVTNS